MSHAEPLQVEPYYAKNRLIVEWWTPAHDALLLGAIRERHWIWYWSISDDTCAITPTAVIEKWRGADPLCKTYAWYNVLMYFAAARAKQLGFFRNIRRPRTKKCPVCDKSFREDSVAPSIVKHMGIDQIDICGECVADGFFQESGNRRLGRPGIVRWIRDVTSQLGIIPPQNLFGSLSSLSILSTYERVKLVKLAKRKPAPAKVKSVFGSWLNALVQAGVLKDGVRETARGTQALARDGHSCLSLGEKTIDDYLFNHGIPHSREPRYPESNYRADFKVGNHLIEYFGLAGDKEYDRKVRQKRQLAKEHGISLIELFPQDLLTEQGLAMKIRPAVRSLNV